jgi:uncharacterized protein YecE (DUF72 family)
MSGARIRIGTAGWSIPRSQSDRAGADGSHLERYARLLSCVEINSSFHRSHRPATYERWAASTPPDFLFSIKMPRAITHDVKLQGAEELIERFLQETAALGEKRGPLLVQLPPSLAFDNAIAEAFFASLRARHGGAIVCEPRHPTWFGADADALLVRHQVARVAADPAPAEGAASPGGWPGLVYVRLHGSPRMYWSRYSDDDLGAIARRLQRTIAPVIWCVFDNTATGAALENALSLDAALGPAGRFRAAGARPPGR